MTDLTIGTALTQLFKGPAGPDAPQGQRAPLPAKTESAVRTVEDTVTLSDEARRRMAADAGVKPKWPGAASEGSAYFGQRNAAGLWLDDNGHSVVLTPDGRKVLVQSENGQQIQAWGDILNDTAGAYSDVDKAKAYKQLVSAWQDGNPNFTQDEKRAAAGIANASDFMTKVSGLNDRIGQIVSGGGNTNSLIAWYDNEAADWEKEIFAGEREKWEAINTILTGVDARVKAGAFKQGDDPASDGETKWLMGLFNKIGQVTSRPWEHPDMRAAMGGILGELRAGYKATA